MTLQGTELHQVGVSFDLYYDARKHNIKIHVLYCSGSMCVGVGPEDGCTNIRNMLSSK